MADDTSYAFRLPIAEGTVIRAAQIGMYAIEHARAAFGLMGADATINLAKVIWAWAIRQEQGVVTRHEMHRAMQCRVHRASELDPALDVLVERGLMRQVQIAGPRAPGRPSVTFAINPRARQSAPGALSFASAPSSRVLIPSEE